LKFTNNLFGNAIPKDRLAILSDATGEEFTASALAEFTQKHADMVAQLQHGLRDAIEHVADMEDEDVSQTFAKRIASHIPEATFEGSVALSFGTVRFTELGKAYSRHVSNRLKTITLSASEDVQVVTMDGTKVLVKLSELSEKVGSIPTEITVSEEDGYAMPKIEFDKMVLHGLGKVSTIDLEDSVIQDIKDAYMDELNTRISDPDAIFPTTIKISHVVDDPECQEKVDLYCMCISDYVVNDRVSAINPFEFTYSSRALCKIRDCSDYIELSSGHLASLNEVSNAYQNFGIEKISRALEEDDEYIDTTDAGRVYVDFEDVLSEVNDIRAATVAEAAMAMSYTAQHIKESIADRFAMVKERVLGVASNVQGKVSSVLTYAYERLSSIPSVGMFLNHTIESSGLGEAASSEDYTFSNSPHYLYTGVSPASAFTLNTLKKVVGQTVQVAAEAVLASFSGILYGVYQAGKALYAGYQAAAHPYDVVRTGKGVAPTVEGISFTRLTPICNIGVGLNLEAFSNGVKLDLKVAEILMYSGKVVFPSVEDRMPKGFDKIWDDLQLQPLYARDLQVGGPDDSIRDIITNQAGLVVPSDYWNNDIPYMHITDGDDLSYARHLMGGFVGAYLHYRTGMEWQAWVNNPIVQSAIDSSLWWSPVNWNTIVANEAIPAAVNNPTTMYELIARVGHKTPFVSGGTPNKMSPIWVNTLINALVVCLKQVWTSLISEFYPYFTWNKNYFLRTIIKYKPVDYRLIDSDIRFYNDGSADTFEFSSEAFQNITYTEPDEEEVVFGDSYRKAREILEGIEFYLSEGNYSLRYSGSTFGGNRGQNYTNYTWYQVLSTGRVIGMDGVCPFVWAVASTSHYNDSSEDRIFVPYVTKLANFLPSMYRLKTDEENIVLYERLMTGVIIAAVVSVAALTLSVLIKKAHRRFSMKAAGQKRAFENTLAATGDWDKDSWRAYKKSNRISNLLSALSGGVKELPTQAFKSMEVSDLLPKKDASVSSRVDTKPLQDSIETVIDLYEPIQDSIETVIDLYEPIQDSIGTVIGLLK